MRRAYPGEAQFGLSWFIKVYNKRALNFDKK